MATQNYVAQLNERAQRERWSLSYEDVEAVGPDHIKRFTLRAVLDGKAYPDGVGRNKKEAKQKAAENVLKSLAEGSPDIMENAAESPTTPAHQPSITPSNYVSWLNEYGHRNKLNIRHIESTTLGLNVATHLLDVRCCYFVVGDKDYPAATGRTKKEAKEEAAKLVYDDIQSEEHLASSSQTDGSNHSVLDISDRMTSMSLTTTDEGVREINYVGHINNYCQERNLSYSYVLEKKCGPAHNPQFSYKLVINHKDYPLGEGRSGMEAKQNAAQLAWSVLQPDRDSKLSPGSAVYEDAAPSRLSETPSTLDACDQNPKDMSTSSSDSVIFTNACTPSRHQNQSPDAKPKIRLAPKFLNADNSKEEPINFKAKNNKTSKSEKGFTSEYDSIQHLGSGAFGRVFKAREKFLEKYYAVKIVRWKEKSLREVKALSDLHHSNIVRYYKCWLEDSQYQCNDSADSCSSSQSACDSSVKFLYIQMELCDTKTLRMWIDDKKEGITPRRCEESQTIAQQIIAGVEYIHSKNFIHRDLKPANIMFGQDQTVKIGDFGLVTAECDDNENLMERTTYKGTPSYMAPEQKSRKTYDRKVDIFALGLIYFEILWNISTSQERSLIWDDVRNQKTPPGFSFTFPLENQIIKSMLCATPEDRPEASKLRMDLEKHLNTPELKDSDSKTV